MTAQDERNLKALALLECEEARQQLALLRAKADQMRKCYEEAARMLAIAKRDQAHREDAAAIARAALQERRHFLGTPFNLDDVFALDNELCAAAERLRDAQQRRKELGLGE